MTVGAINGVQQTSSTHNWQFIKEKKDTNSPQINGSSKDIAATLGVLGSLGVATVAIVKSKNAKKTAESIREATKDIINKEVNKAVKKAKEELKVIQNQNKTEALAATNISSRSKGLGAGTERENGSIRSLKTAVSGVGQQLIDEWESYTPERLAKSEALRARKKEIKTQLLNRGYKYDRGEGQFVAPVSGDARSIYANMPQKKKLDYDLKKVNMLNEYLKSLPKNKYGSITMDKTGKDYIITNILKKEFSTKSSNTDELREQCRTLKKFNRVIKGKVIGSGAPKTDLMEEINNLIQGITARIDEIMKKSVILNSNL